MYPPWISHDGSSLCILAAFTHCYATSAFRLFVVQPRGLSLPACTVIMATSSSENTPAKLRKLDERRRRLPHCTASALSSIYKDVAEHGLPEMMDRNSIDEASREIVNTDTPYGSLITEMKLHNAEADKKQIRIPAVNPLAYLWLAVYSGGAF